MRSLIENGIPNPKLNFFGQEFKDQFRTKISVFLIFRILEIFWHFGMDRDWILRFGLKFEFFELWAKIWAFGLKFCSPISY